MIIFPVSFFYRLNCGVCSIAPDFSSIYAEFLHAVEQRAAFHSKSKGRAVRSTDATVGFTQHTNDPSLLLEVAYYFRRIYSAAYLCRQRNIESTASSQDYGPFNQVLQLTHISRPVPAHEFLHHRCRNRLNLFAHTLRVLLREVFHQQRNIFAALAQRRKLDGKNIQAIIEIAAKL